MSFMLEPFSMTMRITSTKYLIGLNSVMVCAYFGILSIGVNKPLININITVKNQAINMACCCVSVKFEMNNPIPNTTKI